MQQLNAHDAMFAHFDNENWAAHGGIVGIYDPSTAPGGHVRFRDILAHLERRLACSPVFRRRLVRVPLDLDHPYWIEDEHFDLEFHVRHVRLPEPADWRQLCIQIARIDARPLDMNRPPWEMWVIEGLDHVEGVPAGSYAIFTKLHHVAVDGHSMRDIISAIHDLTPELDATAIPDSWHGERRPGARQLLTRAAANNLVHAPLRVARAVVRFAPAARLLPGAVLGSRGSSGGLLPPAVPRTRFQAELSPHRVLDGRTFPLAEVKRMRELVEGATVNDVIVNARDAAGDIGDGVGDVGAEGDEEEGDVVAAGGLLALARTRGCPRCSRPSPGGRALAASQLAFGARRPTFNIGVSNVPGPHVPLYMNGAKAERFFGVAPIFSGTGLVFGVFSYCGVIDASFVSCRRMVPDPAFLAECLDAAFEELRTAVGVAAGAVPA
ncbi:WS/DGAT domain-containing protein [Paraconexibacter antarcticus]|uniref:diacylglycerol O-acyltransferase n=1 Tax=Paraconexibacter antarcticus TaxID=2949664 RepID=A0ABY5E1H5_9ACTN|nr:wax ester/triacylglycerol synthase domain-containing protein [Paraconexibacter antarcticus]UTI66687.1 WS/DGAT domain-containing protein [Paraconexibacter antarcticus]